MTAHNTAIAAATAGPGLEGAVGRWVYVGADGIARLQTDPTSNTTSGILVKGESEGELVSIVHSGMCSRFTPGTLIEPWDFVASGVDGSVVKAAGDAVVLGRYVPDVMSVDGMLDASGTKAWGLSIAPLGSSGSGASDFSGEFVAAYDSGNVGFGTQTPTDLGAGTKNVEIDSVFLSVMRFLNSGTVIGTILAGFGQLSIATTGVVDLTFGTDGSNRLNLRGDGAIELPTIEDADKGGLVTIDGAGSIGRSFASVRPVVFARMTSPGVTFSNTALTAQCDTAIRAVGFSQTAGLAEFTCDVAGVFQVQAAFSIIATTSGTVWIEVNGADTPSSVMVAGLDLGLTPLRTAEYELSLVIGDVVRIRLELAGVLNEYSADGCFIAIARVA